MWICFTFLISIIISLIHKRFIFISIAAQKPASPVVLRPTSAQIPLESSSLSSAVHQEITLRHKASSVSRQDSHLSVKSLIESIENATKQAKSG